MSLPANLSTLDPFTQVYLVWREALITSPAIISQVKRIENIVAFSEGGEADQMRDSLKDVDLPELVLWARGVTGNLNLATNLVDITRDYAITITTEAGKVTEKLFPLEWAITSVLTMFNFKQSLTELTWQNERFVKHVAFGGADSGASDPANNRGQKGWAAVWRLQVRMSFSQAAMKAFEGSI